MCDHHELKAKTRQTAGGTGDKPMRALGLRKSRWKGIISVALFLIAFGCANSEFRFEKIEDGKTIPMPLKLASLNGTRDGDKVTAEARFSSGGDNAQMNVRLRLVPPAEFVSGTYRMTVGGQTIEGIVECLSLDYQGGQNSVPSMGGRFILKPDYRVTFPSTPIKRP